MPWKPPKEVVFGEGRTLKRITVKVCKLSEFHKTMREQDPDHKGRLHCAWYCDDDKTLYLRADRMNGPEGRIDFLHELHHAYIEWAGEFYEQG